MRIVHLSDLHFGALATGRPEALHAAVRAAAPELIVVSGDLSQSGTVAELAEARAFLDALPQPQLVVPGNHDMPHGLHLWSRFRRPFAAYQKVIQSDLEPVWRNDTAVVAGLNSAIPGGWYLDWERGRFSARQLLRLREIVAETPQECLRVLVIHHPPAAPPGGTRRHLIDNRTALFGALNEAGIDLILSGHFHLSYAMAIALPGADPRSCILSVTSTATSHRLRGEPNGFHVIEGDSRALNVQAWTWARDAYRPGAHWHFARGEHRDWQEI